MFARFLFVDGFKVIVPTKKTNNSAIERRTKNEQKRRSECRV